jgi:hypothetical protein
MYKPVKTTATALRRHNPDVALDAISKASAWRRRDSEGFAKALAKENLDYRAALRDFQLAFVAKLVLYLYDKPRLSQRQFDWKDLLNACRALTKHQDPSAYPVKSPEDATRFMIRVAYQQFPDFYGDTDTLARTRLLFRSCARTVGSEMSFDIDTAYKEATGLTFDQTWDITIALFGFVLTKNGGVQSGPLKAGDLRQNISESDIAQFVNRISLSPTQFKGKMELPQYQIDRFETFNPNPLVDWPMIKLENNRWVVPILPYLFRRGTEQAFYDVIGYKGRDFAGFFGYVFEAYVDRILETLGPSYGIIPEKQYLRNRRATCDRIIIKGSNAVLIECKTKRLKLKTKFTADEDLLRDDLTDVGKGDDKSSVVSGIRQLYRTEQDIRTNCSGLEELHQKITGKIYPLVLVLDPYYFANTPYIKQIIAEELKKGDPPIKDYGWQILDARGLEPLCSLARQEDFVDLIAKKFSSPELQEQDMKIFVDNFVNENKISRDTLIHPALNAELDAFWGELESRYNAKFRS